MEKSSSSSTAVHPSSPSCKIMKSDPDRLSELPESLHHIIFSFLDTQQAVQTSVLSKTWRYSWTSLSHLNLNHAIWKSITRVPSAVFRKLSFIKFVDRVMELAENPNLQKLYMNCQYCGEDDINKWLGLAVGVLDTKEIDLTISATKDEKLPRGILQSSVSVFKLNANLLTRLPQSMRSSAQLQTLDLTSAILPKHNSEGKLLLRCPKLETLRMVNCDHHVLQFLILDSPELKSLVICNSSKELVFSGCTLKIRTPKLLSLSLKGSLYGSYNGDSFPSLVTADIEISGLMDSSESASGKHMVDILKGVHGVSTLRLNNRSFELPLLENMLEQFPNPFFNLRHLKLFWSENTGLRVITNALRSSQIETLVLQLHRGLTMNMDQGGDLSHEGMFCHLKYVQINNFSDSRNQNKILELLLQNAMILENLTIGLSPTLLSSKESVERSIMKRFNGLRKASSNVNISFRD